MASAELYRNAINMSGGHLTALCKATKSAGLPTDGAELTAARKFHADLCAKRIPPPTNYEELLQEVAKRVALDKSAPVKIAASAEAAADKVIADLADDAQYGYVSRSIAAYNKIAASAEAAAHAAGGGE